MLDRAPHADPVLLPSRHSRQPLLDVALRLDYRSPFGLPAGCRVVVGLENEVYVPENCGSVEVYDSGNAATARQLPKPKRLATGYAHSGALLRARHQLFAISRAKASSLGMSFTSPLLMSS
jgi:hypothetical protein